MFKGDRVILVQPFAHLPVGAEGQILGVYKQVAGEFIAVLFDGGRTESVPVAFFRILDKTPPVGTAPA